MKLRLETPSNQLGNPRIVLPDFSSRIPLISFADNTPASVMSTEITFSKQFIE